MSCPFEDRVAAAHARSEWSPELEDHVMSCPSCAEELLVRAFFSEASAAVETLGAAPDPELVWLRARLERRRTEAQRAIGPIQVVERLALVTATAAAAFGLWQLGPSLRGVFGQLDFGSLGRLPASFGNPWLVVLMSGSVLVLIWLADLYQHWVEE